MKKLSFVRSYWKKVPLLTRYLTALVILLALAGGLWFYARTQAKNLVSLRIGTSINAFQNNDFATSIAQADQVLTQDPKNVDALLAKATTLAQEGSINFQETTYAPQAIAIAQQALAIDPQNSDAWRIIGYSYEIMQQYPQAHDAYAKSLALNPNNVATISQNAHAFDLQGDLTQAEAGYRKALSIEPNIDQANMGLGRILLSENKPQEALKYFTTAQQISGNVRTRAEAAYSVGMTNNILGNTAAVAPAMKQATTIDPTYSLGWVGLGDALFAQALATSSTLTLAQSNALITESIGDFQKAINLAPYQAAASVELGKRLIVLGNKKAGIQMLKEAATLVPNDITLSAPNKTGLLGNIEHTIEVASKLK